MATTINIRELYRNLKEITQRVQRGESFVVLKNAKPVFRIESTRNIKHKPFTLTELEKLQFKSGEKDLSKKIDEIVYGDM